MVGSILVIFKYVVAYIILYSKRSSPAQTDKFWPRTNSQYMTPAGKLPDFGQQVPPAARSINTALVKIASAPISGAFFWEFSRSFFEFLNFRAKILTRKVVR